MSEPAQSPVVPVPAAAAESAEVPAITPAQLRELALADERDRALSGARTLALCNGLGFVVCAAVCLISVLFDPWSLLYVLVLGGFGFVELRARRALLAYDRGALRRLSRNQIAFCAAVVAYALVQMVLSARSDNPLLEIAREHPELSDALGSPEMSGMKSELDSWYRIGMPVFYGLLGLVTLLFQGGSAVYYARREKVLDAFVTQTPAWVIEFRRSRAGALPSR